MSGKTFLAVLVVAVLIPPTLRAEDSSLHREQPSTESGIGVVRLDPYSLDLVPRRLRKPIFRATVLAKRGEHEAVAHLLGQKLENQPELDHYLLRYYLGQSLASLGRHAEAAEHFKQAVVLNPELDRAWIGFGDSSYKEKDFAAAAEGFERGFHASPERPISVLYSAAAAALQSGNARKSLELFKELESGKWGTMKQEWYRGLAAAALQAHEAEEARPGLERMLRRHPDSAESWNLWYKYNVGLQDYHEAAVALTVTGYLRELTEKEHDQLGDLFTMLGIPALSLEQYRGAINGEFSARQYEKLVSAALAAHDTDRALSIIEEALALGETPRLYSLQGDVYYRQRDYDAARTSFAKVLELDPEYSRAYLMVGYCSVELGEKEVALDNLGRVTQDPKHGDIAQLLIQRALALVDEES